MVACLPLVVPKYPAIFITDLLLQAGGGWFTCVFGRRREGFNGLLCTSVDFIYLFIFVEHLVLHFLCMKGGT